MGARPMAAADEGAIIDIADLKPDRNNRRRHNARNLAEIRRSLDRTGPARSIVVDEDLAILAGNGTVQAAAEAGITKIQIVPVARDTLLAAQIIGLDAADKRFLGIADNRTAELAEWDLDQLLADQAAGLPLDQWEPGELERLLAEAQPAEVAPAMERASLADRFIVPPFSVLDARQGYWQDRKRRWLAYGIESELGRGENITWPDEPPMVDLHHYRHQRRAGDNGLLGYSQQARSHYANATPGGSPMPAAQLGPDGRTVRGDGRGRPFARVFGQDLMRGEHTVGQPDARAIKDHAWQLEHLERPQARIQFGTPGMAYDGGPMPRDVTRPKTTRIAKQGARPSHGHDVWQKPDGTLLYSESNNPDAQSGTSIFDPVLCELAYRWFCPPGGLVLDPFAGGSVRGIMAALLGRRYLGIDLSARQIAANAAQAATIVPRGDCSWIEGDSLELLPAIEEQADFLFSCPPYADLERYSDDPRDLSTMPYDAFLAAYRQIIAAGVGRLRPDRFACFVIGDVRDPQGNYRNLVSETIGAFQAAGAQLYNDAILVTAVGSLPIRVGRQFSQARKLGKTHQNVLVFIRGDARAAVQACGQVEVTLPEPEEAGA